jgi:beta-lactamase regulating signal transducer with metallopeptidase domain
MNELGMTVVWLAVQVSLVLAPAVALYALASRRGPDGGAWVATLSLGLVVALNAAALLPGIGRGRAVGDGRLEESPRPTDAAASPGSSIAADRAAWIRPVGERWSLARLRIAWVRLERQAAEPAARCRPWGGGLAVLTLAAAVAGLIQLALGMGAIVACRRRGRAVDDPAMLELLDDLRRAMGCRAPVELREVADLVGPATAGWWRPLVLLPDDWRSWDQSERRAVLAHELAHIVRGDYAAGLIARLAVALNYYHPLVHWVAGQLRLQQELAADAMGARHAGGRGGYLVALSRLALRQDGRSPCWPARAFLPARGTLIRRIAMLRDEARTGTDGRPWPRSSRVGATVFLLSMTAAVATLRGPVRGSEDASPAAARDHAEAPAARAADAPTPPLYVPEKVSGVLVLRPARAYRHAAVKRIAPRLDNLLGGDLSELWTLSAKVMARPGAVKLAVEDLEWITAGVRFGHSKNPDGAMRQTFMLGWPAFRTVAPFDWLAFLRQWRLEFTKVREGKAVYYRVKGQLSGILGPDPCVYLPDDRTIVWDGEKEIRKLAVEGPLSPTFARDPDWQRACRGLAALVINNESGAFVKAYDVGSPDDALFLSLFKGVEHWTLSVDDADSIALRAAAACLSADASGAIARSVESLVKKGRDDLDGAARQKPEEASNSLEFRMLKTLMDKLHIDHGDRSIHVHTEGFGTLADLATIVEANGQSEATSRKPPQAPTGLQP